MENQVQNKILVALIEATEGLIQAHRHAASAEICDLLKLHHNQEVIKLQLQADGYRHRLQLARSSS